DRAETLPTAPPRRGFGPVRRGEGSLEWSLGRLVGSVRPSTRRKTPGEVAALKVLVIGKGGREHALCWKLKQSPRVRTVFCAPGNAGSALDAQNVAIEAGDFRALAQFAKREGVGLTVVGPEEPLTQGIV